jgi:hypothetical protein
MKLVIVMPPPTQGELRYTIERCEHYLNSRARTSRQYYFKLRKKALKDLIRLQIQEYLCSAI